MKWRFWRWLVFGINSKSGISRFFDAWIFLHFGVAVILTLFVELSLKEAASTVLLPLSSVFFGLSFAWSGNSQALLQDSAIEELSKHHPDGIENYIYTFMLAIFVILLTLAAWGVAGLGIFQKRFFSTCWWQLSIKAILYFLGSLTLRECWHVVIGSQLMLMSRYTIKKNKKKEP
jgi:hypothetical protein